MSLRLFIVQFNAGLKPLRCFGATNWIEEGVREFKNKKPRQSGVFVFYRLTPNLFMVPSEGLEPPRFWRWYLKPVRLPIPPTGHWKQDDCLIRDGFQIGKHLFEI
jgi:hypothetical protein